MKKSYWLVSGIVIGFLIVMALGYAFHEPSREWMKSRAASVFKKDDDQPKTIEELKAQLGQKKDEVQQKFEAELSKAREELEELKKEKEALEAELKRLVEAHEKK